ncbi:uncharacterized protein J7T54_000649 [Emericellopsis cladophorae]|uniref:Uncharacterized protein n=1 Tax=Emericellopsis cladophorae TaxID=2686198 RepID=A0A9P9Y457_9HYPO|nr:uncharacterized protein J7T54_000649 [Emericellopsis cladophorae]KAI6783147.1 hypothetical protein J7T54_000649 [Emericellopsis cladophorae]
MPPNSRSMRIEDFVRECRGIGWREERIKSLDGTEIALCISDEVAGSQVDLKLPPAYVMYFQGNASSLPPRLPDLSAVLHRLRDIDPKTRYVVVCLSYRGYWTSHDRASEKGINMDAEAGIRWISRHSQHSIGCGFATKLAATTKAMKVDGLVLETPFTSTRDMLKALYPQKWLPYQYLWPFLRNFMDSWTNLGIIRERASGAQQPGIYMVEAGKDELVPCKLGQRLFERCQDLGLPVERSKIRSALHNEVIVRPQGKQAIAQSIASAVGRARQT